MVESHGSWAEHSGGRESEQAPLLSEQQERSTPNAQAERGTFSRSLTARDGFVLLVSVIIGSGIFASPAQVDSNVPSPGAALLIWGLGGALAWTGATGMAELGAAFPGEGGIQSYLTYIYGEYVGFLAAWAWVACVMPATLAILSIVFVETIFTAFLPDSGLTGSSWAQKGIAVAVLFIMTGVNCLGTKSSTTLGNIFAVIKLGTIFLVVLAGLVTVFLHVAHPDEHRAGNKDWYRRGWFESRTSVTPNGELHWENIAAWEALGHYSTALYSAFWAYSSWDKANYAAGELQNPAKQLPLAINTALPVIISCYLLVNAAYYVLLPWNQIGLSDAIAVQAFRALLGKPAAIVAAILIVLVIAGALNGNIFVAGRLTVAAAKRAYLPSVFARLGTPFSKSAEPSKGQDDDGKAPIAALLLIAVLSTAYILIGSFRALLTYDGIAEYTFFFLTILGVLILRYKEPTLERPYKPPVILAVLFTIVSGAVVLRGAIFAPIQGGTVLAVLAVGLIGFVVSQKIRHRNRQPDT